MARQPGDSAKTITGDEQRDESEVIRDFAALLDETKLTEIEIEREWLRVRVARHVSVGAPMPAS